MPPLSLLLVGAASVAVMMALLWLVQRARRDAGVVDVGWAAGLGLLAILYAAGADGDVSRRLLLALLAGLWAFRLAAYLLLNRVIGHEEDGRYQALRAYWGNRAQPYFFLFFQGQALLDVLLSLPFLVIAANPRPGLGGWEVLAVALWLVAVTGESIADAQLARFRADPAHRGRTCRAGLWRYSRHPNYFFEWLHWWVYVPLGVGSPYWWVTLLSPLVMLVFILKLTGIPPTEARALASRGEDYRDYQRTTSAFFPWFPKRNG